MKTQWEVKFEGKMTPAIVTASTFLEAAEIATKISSKIVSIKYLAY